MRAKFINESSGVILENIKKFSYWVHAQDYDNPTDLIKDMKYLQNGENDPMVDSIEDSYRNAGGEEFLDFDDMTVNYTYDESDGRVLGNDIDSIWAAEVRVGIVDLIQKMRSEKVEKNF